MKIKVTSNSRQKLLVFCTPPNHTSCQEWNSLHLRIISCWPWTRTMHPYAYCPFPYTADITLSTFVRFIVSHGVAHMPDLQAWLLLFSVPRFETTDLKKLQAIQNTTAYLPSNTGCQNPITPVLCSLPVEYLARFNISVFIFKSLPWDWSMLLIRLTCPM